tara:strand:- start:966 stop:1442 length:477 start_codon:yes stop_codon:yes gene_type:complete
MKQLDRLGYSFKKNNMSNFKKIKIYNYKVIHKLKGKIFKYFSSKDKNFLGFGETYVSSISSKETRAWKYHSKAHMNLFVIKGKIKFAFYCPVVKKIKTLKSDSKKYQRINVPPKIWYGFKNLSNTESLIMNITNLIHKKKEIKNKPLSFIKFKWDQKN